MLDFSLSSLYNANVANFIIVVAFMTWVVKKFQLMNAIDRKKKDVINQIDNAEEQSAVAKKSLSEAQEAYQNVNATAGNILKEAENTAKSLSKKIDEETKNEITQIEENRARIELAEKNAAINEVQQEIGKMAYQIAKQHITGAIDENMHKKFINEFIDELDKIKV